MNKNKWFLNGGRGSGKSIRLLCETYENKIADLEKENADLRVSIENTRCAGIELLRDKRKQLTKAKEIIKKFLLWENDWHNKTESKYELLKEAEQLLKEIE